MYWRFLRWRGLDVARYRSRRRSAISQRPSSLRRRTVELGAAPAAVAAAHDLPAGQHLGVTVQDPADSFGADNHVDHAHVDPALRGGLVGPFHHRQRRWRRAPRRTAARLQVEGVSESALAPLDRARVAAPGWPRPYLRQASFRSRSRGRLFGRPRRYPGRRHLRRPEWRGFDPVLPLPRADRRLRRPEGWDPR